MTMLPNHTQITGHASFCGSPARQTAVSPEHITNVSNGTIDNSSPSKTICYGLLHYIGFIFTGSFHIAAYLPGLWFITYIQNVTQSFASVFVTAPLGAVMSMSMYYACIRVYQKIFLNQIIPGTYSIKSLFYLRQWIMIKLLDSDEVSVLADSLYFPPLLRFLGAKLGRRVEMGETPHILPSLVTLEDEAFTASSVGLAWPNVYQGLIQFSPVKVGGRAFSGNVSLLPSGTSLGDGALLGCLTLPPSNNEAVENHTSWLGSPAIFLPKRELFMEFSEKDTITPPRKTIVIRLAIEFIRVILPTSYTLVGLYSLVYVLEYFLSHMSLLSTFCLLPLAELGIILTLVTSLVLLKWMVQGRLQPTVKPLWDIFIRKIDLIEFSWSYFINPHLSNLLLGTPFMPMLLRCFGSKIGKKTCIGTAEFAEFDLITVGNNVCINSETLMDTHLYEDRIFKTSTINIQDGCNVGSGSIVLYDTVMETDSNLGNLSLLMKGERLPANTSWQGIPAQSKS